MNVIADEAKLNNDAQALLLTRLINELDLKDCFVYYNFPFYRGESKDDLVQAHVLFVSKEYGVIFFRCLNETRQFTELEQSKLDDLDGHIFSKINKQDSLRKHRRELKINVTPIVFIGTDVLVSDPIFVGPSSVKKSIYANKKDELSDEEFRILISVIEGSYIVRQKKDRVIKDESVLSKGQILNILQSKETVFDLEQKRAALNIIDSPQRIRGLAGSGKTIILSMKAALYHLQNPDSEILYTYFTKALYGQVKYLIEKYYRDFSENREPNWKKIHIYHGWGGRGLNGVYSDTCFENGIEPVTFFQAKSINPKMPFDYVCEELNKFDLRQKYDLTLIDEGQDFPKHFYRVCRKITKENRLVWAYDDFQNIFDVEIQDEKETFGKGKDGEYYVDFSREENQLQDIVLYKCYRNPRLVLLNAFALGLGIYNRKVLQRLENNKHWEDLGFEVEKGESKDREEMIISRPEQNSPIDTNKYFTGESIKMEIFDSAVEECKYIVSQIEKDIREENLRPDDICVISLDSSNISIYFGLIQEGLLAKRIKVFNLLDAPSNNTFFSVENHVTLSTINKAKGNETGMVYIVGTDQAFIRRDYIIDRNKVFTAITRSKGWVTLTGFDDAKFCRQEMLTLKENDYKLRFIQPRVEDTKTILRGMNDQQSFINEYNRLVEKFVKVSGLPEEEVKKIIASQNKGKK
jgi:superfamily I DNA and RNA helicase